MKPKRKKHQFRVHGFGKVVTVMARNHASAVHQFRRAVQPIQLPTCGAQAGVTQIQPRTLENGAWEGIAIEPINREPRPERIEQPVPPPFVSRIEHQAKPPEPLAAGLHPDTALPTPKWEWMPVDDSANRKAGKPIDYQRVNKQVA